MLLIHCPYCEEARPELEFRAAGEAHIARPERIAEENEADFEKYLFIRSNPKGIIFERWRHIHGCARFFNAVRDTVSDKFLMTYKAGEPKPALPAVPGDGGPAAWANVPPAKLNVKTPARRKAAKTRQGEAK